MSKPVGNPIHVFVRNAWTLLVFQLVAAAAALGVTGWAVLQVRPLFEQRERLAKDIEKLREDEKEARAIVAELEQRAVALRNELKGARDATPVLTAAINAFHKRRYADAIVKYDEALRLNPGDPYIYNLKSYSQFKAGDFTGAIATLSRGLQLDPTYEWGYFDLARYQCAANSPDAALRTITDALAERGEGVRSALKFFLSQDGEFRRLCSPILGDLRRLAQ
jgi:tetratricopeptide (TPR) repeat protein